MIRTLSTLFAAITLAWTGLSTADPMKSDSHNKDKMPAETAMGNVNLPVTAHQWVMTGVVASNGTGSLQAAPAFGDLSKGEHATFVKMPAGFISTLHTHTHDYYGVVITGIGVNTAVGGKDVPLAIAAYQAVERNALPIGGRTAVPALPDDDEAEQPGQDWATQLHAVLGEIKHHVDQGRAAGQAASPPAVRDAFVRRYRDVLVAGSAANPPPHRTAGGPKRGRLKQSPARNLLDRLTTHEAEVLAFLHDWTVPFDNNQAERDLRMVKVQQKISGTFRDASGADAFCRIRGDIGTLRKQARQVLTALEGALLGQPPFPCLQPE